MLYSKMPKTRNYLNAHEPMNDKLRYFHTVEYYLVIKWEKMMDLCKHRDEFQMHYAKWKYPDSKGNILHGSIYMIF